MALIDHKNNLQLQYSQNFLRSEKLVNIIINKSSIGADDVVYEIGPGKGIITKELAKRCLKIVGIERDRLLFNYLKNKFYNNSKIKIVHGDFLNYDLPKKERYKIFSNIPFNLTADIIRKLVYSVNPATDIYLIVQKESAKRFAGLPYNKETQFSLLLKPWFKIKILYSFKRIDFYPTPQVNTVLLHIEKIKKPLISQENNQIYRDFVIYGFNQWKFRLSKSLNKIFTYEQIKRLGRDLNFNFKTATPTDLSFNQWLALFNYFIKEVDVNKKKLIFGAENLLKRQQNRLQKTHRTRLFLKSRESDYK